MSYKQALRDASPSYKIRNNVPPEIPKLETPVKTKRKYKDKVDKIIL
jgi:hypothetical protein